MHFINTSDLLGPEWRFLEPLSQKDGMTWQFVYGRPRNLIEQRLRRPNVARWRAAAQAVGVARQAPERSVLVSHLPLMAAATETLRARYTPDTPHIAFAFNYTELPEGWRRRSQSKAFAGVDEFIVFSQFEVDLYADHFDIPKERLRFLPWAMDPPEPGPVLPLSLNASSDGYLCSIGGEGRDYALLADVMADRPDTVMAVVARPYSIAGVQFPPNVRVFTDLPHDQTWKIAQDSAGLVIPLKSETTACGHITMVGAQKLGLPLVITRSHGIADYVENEVTGQVVPAGDGRALGAAIDRLRIADPTVGAMSHRAKKQAKTRNSLGAWLNYFEELDIRLSATTL